MDISSDVTTIMTDTLRRLLKPIRKRIPILNRPKIYCFWLSIGVITTSTATGDSTSASNQKRDFFIQQPCKKLTP
ncbi:hypothetical protein [Klebsiella pneumoniae IS10]|nr:hypothetical protein [Klebsiella pneumoniae IS10]CDK69090.1 hypothetical protein [Klebsiella pneumoniae IS22]